MDQPLFNTYVSIWKMFDNIPFCGSDCHWCFSFLLVMSPLLHRASKGKGRWAPWTHICKYLPTYTCWWGLKYWKIHFYFRCKYTGFTGLSCTRRRKHLEMIKQYWREKAQAYYKRSDEGTKTDSQDSLDHRVWPTDTTATTHQKKRN